MVIHRSLAWFSWGSWQGASVLVAIPQLETRCRSLRSTQQAASTENQQLEESNRVLEDHLQHLRQQLQQTQGRLQAARASVVWERTEEPG